jgi:hypothetical protein
VRLNQVDIHKNNAIKNENPAPVKKYTFKFFLFIAYKKVQKVKIATETIQNIIPHKKYGGNTERNSIFQILNQEK